MDNKTECNMSVYLYQQKAYVATSAKTNVGAYIDIEPIYIANRNMEELIEIIKQACQAGNPKIPHPSQKEINHLKQPVLAAAKVSSWRIFAKNGATYSVSIKPTGITLEVSKLDKQGRFVWDAEKRKSFPTETSFYEIARAILDDASSRPELQNEN